MSLQALPRRAVTSRVVHDTRYSMAITGTNMVCRYGVLFLIATALTPAEYSAYVWYHWTTITLAPVIALAAPALVAKEWPARLSKQVTLRMVYLGGLSTATLIGLAWVIAPPLEAAFTHTTLFQLFVLIVAARHLWALAGSLLLSAGQARWCFRTNLSFRLLELLLMVLLAFSGVTLWALTFSYIALWAAQAIVTGGRAYGVLDSRPPATTHPLSLRAALANSAQLRIADFLQIAPMRIPLIFCPVLQGTMLSHERAFIFQLLGALGTTLQAVFLGFMPSIASLTTTRAQHLRLVAHFAGAALAAGLLCFALITALDGPTLAALFEPRTTITTLDAALASGCVFMMIMTVGLHLTLVGRQRLHLATVTIATAFCASLPVSLGLMHFAPSLSPLWASFINVSSVTVAIAGMGIKKW